MAETVDLSVIEKMFNQFKDYLPRLVAALIALIIGWLVTKLLITLTKKAIKKSHLSANVQSFVKSLIKIGLYTILCLLIINILGIETNSIITLFSALGVALSLSVKDTLSNFAEGVMILIAHPFVVGDYIEATGIKGTVKEISVLYTYLITPDNKKIHVPNGKLSDAIITNFTNLENRRIDITMSAGEKADEAVVKNTATKVLIQNKYVLETPAPIVRISGYDDGLPLYIVQVWVETQKYEEAYYELVEQMKGALDTQKINLVKLILNE